MILVNRRANIRQAVIDHWEPFRAACVGMGVSPSLLDRAKIHVVTDPRDLDPNFLTLIQRQDANDVARGITRMIDSRHNWEEFLDTTRVVYYVYVLGRR